MEIRGYKAFNKDHTNKYGKFFEENKDYHIDGPISFGLKGNGYHMCTHLSDVFRYFPSTDVSVAAVIGSGAYVLGEDESWMEPYDDMYSVSDIYIQKFLTREEIISIMELASSSDLVKFFATFKLAEYEGIRLLDASVDKSNYYRVVAAFLYYIKGINTYALFPEDRIKTLRKVLDNGQDSNQRSKGK